jgi:hypothetical protein
MSKRPAPQQTTPEKLAMTPEKLPITPEKTPQKPIGEATSSGSPDQEKSLEKSPEKSPVKGTPGKMSDAVILSLEPLPYSVIVLDEGKKRKMSVPFVAPFANLEKEVVDIKRRLSGFATMWNLTYQRKKNIELEERLLAQEEELKEFRQMKARAAEASLLAEAAAVFESLAEDDGLEKDAEAAEKEGAEKEGDEEKEADSEEIKIVD